MTFLDVTEAQDPDDAVEEQLCSVDPWYAFRLLAPFLRAHNARARGELAFSMTAAEAQEARRLRRN